MRIFAFHCSALLVITVVAGAYLTAPSPLHFESARELRDLAESSGFLTHNEGVNPDTVFFVTERPVTKYELRAVASRSECGRSDAWKGIVWVTQLRTAFLDLDPDQMTGNYRVWGNILVAGDDELIDQLEQTILRRRQGAN